MESFSARLITVRVARGADVSDDAAPGSDEPEFTVKARAPSDEATVIGFDGLESIVCARLVSECELATEYAMLILFTE